MRPSLSAARMALDENAAPPSLCCATTSTAKPCAAPCAARNSGEPLRPLPKWKSKPTATPRIASVSHKMLRTKSSARQRRQRGVERQHDGAVEAGRAKQAELRSPGRRGGNAACRAGRRRADAARRSAPRRAPQDRRARASAAAMTARWPRCTPSKLPMATTAPASALPAGGRPCEMRKGKLVPLMRTCCSLPKGHQRAAANAARSPPPCGRGVGGGGRGDFGVTRRHPPPCTLPRKGEGTLEPPPLRLPPSPRQRPHHGARVDARDREQARKFCEVRRSRGGRALRRECPR